MSAHDPSLDRTLHAIADSTRRRILELLKEQSSRSPASLRRLPAGSSHLFAKEGCSGLCAGDIEERVKLSQPTVSHHMAILTKSGLVEMVKRGQWRWYRRNEKAIRQMLKGLRARI
jgi:DNA-binding transcriptional ArsR family regulator